MDNLSLQAKEILRNIVKFIPEASTGEELHFCGFPDAPCHRKGIFEIPLVFSPTPLRLDELQKHDLINWHRLTNSSMTCFVTPKGVKAVESNFYTPPTTHEEQTKSIGTTPPEISDSLEAFRKRYPDPSKVAFIMERFAETKAHKQITKTIRATLLEDGITALRADDFEFHHDLFPNILTYIYGCSFGIAVFERIETNDFNANVALEVGYMLALSKPVCLFKDKNHLTLPADLGGKLFKKFDPLEPESTIPPQLKHWLISKRIIESAPPQKQITKEHEDALKRLAELETIVEDSEVFCPKCSKPLATRGLHTYYGGGNDATVCISHYECGSIYEDSKMLEPCGTKRFSETS